MTTIFASLGKSKVLSVNLERRKALNAEAKRALRRLYAAHKAIELHLRQTTLAVQGFPVEGWEDALTAYEAALAPYLAVAKQLPAAPQEDAAA